MEATYLSVDLDYWTAEPKRGMQYFVGQVLSLDVPICLVASHESLLKHINSFSFKRLINVDFHSDIVAIDGAERNEGTWACFVKRSNRKTFEWRYPSRKYRLEGICDVDLERPHQAGWEAFKASQGTNNLPWTSIIAVGIAISPTWWKGLIHESKDLTTLNHLLRLAGLQSYTDVFTLFSSMKKGVFNITTSQQRAIVRKSFQNPKRPDIRP